MPPIPQTNAGVEMTRADFYTMTAHRQSLFCLSGGKVVDVATARTIKPAPSPVLTRAAWEALDAIARHAFIANGGRLHN